MGTDAVCFGQLEKDTIVTMDFFFFNFKLEVDLNCTEEEKSMTNLYECLVVYLSVCLLVYLSLRCGVRYGCSAFPTRNFWYG